MTYFHITPGQMLTGHLQISQFQNSKHYPYYERIRPSWCYQRTGRAAVILDKTEYEQKIGVMLSDKKTYERLEKDPTPSYKRRSVSILSKLKEEGKIISIPLRRKLIRYTVLLIYSPIMLIKPIIQSTEKKTTIIERWRDGPTRCIKEAVHIRKDGHRTMTRDEGSYQLSHAYDRFLDATADRCINEWMNENLYSALKSLQMYA